jgi:nucleoside-diphosphate-sugar epimerase
LCHPRLYGLDFRGLRLATVLGPGAETHGYLEYLNKAIEASVTGRPYALYVAPRSRVPIIHVEDAARALIELAAAPRERIETVNYIVLGQLDTPSTQDLVDAIYAKIPDAQLSFEVDEEFQKMLDSNIIKPFDEGYARSEWGWAGRFDLPATVESFINDRAEHPERYA